MGFADEEHTGALASGGSPTTDVALDLAARAGDLHPEERIVSSAATSSSGDTPQSVLVERLRVLLTDESSTREVSMFGGRAFMVAEKMVVSAGKGGDLLARVAAERHDELTARPGATQAEMGAGRTMGPGWVSVHSQALASDAQLASWLGTALEHNR